jgi:exopolysaccharide biosynthesis protein
MKRFTALLLTMLLTLSVLPALGQDSWGTDPLCFDYDPADTKLYDDHDHLKIAVKRVDESPKRVYFICDIQVRSPQVLTTAFFNEKNVKKTAVLEKIAKANDAVLAINCDFCGDHDSGIIIRNGKKYRATHTSKLDILIVDKNGDMRVHIDPIKTDAEAEAIAGQLMDEGVLQTMSFGPALVDNGQALSLDKKKHVISTRSTQLEPRTGIGQIGPLHYVVIVVEGRRDGYSKGSSLQDFQQLFLNCGARVAINLDGGSTKLYGSPSELWFDGKNSEIINRPTSPSRQISDALIFK